MYKTHFLFCLIVVSLFSSFFACNDNYEDYSVNPGDVLSFSRDTVHFDTVLTTINTPVQYLMVYNRNSKPLLISSIGIESGEASEFKINVDGIAGKTFQDIAIRPKDSLYILVDLKPEMNGEVNPTLLEDYIVFTTNGVRQKVLLEAYGQDVFIWEGKILSSDTLICASKPILIRDSLLIDENARLSVEEGVCFYMDNNAKVIVKGSISLKGSQENPVVFRGRRTDYLLSSLSYDLVPGQWDGFYFHENSFGNEIEYAYIRNGKSGLYFEASDPGKEKMRMKNVILSNFSGALIESINCWITAENCEFSNSRFALLNLTGGIYRFTHCTLGNFMLSSPQLGWANSNNETLILNNGYQPLPAPGEKELPDSVFFPLIQADFTNTIIWGKNYLSHSKIQLNKKEGQEFNFLFRNCIIPNKGENDEQFIDCIFNTYPVFAKTSLQDPETEEYGPVNLRLKEKENEKSAEISPAIDKADPEYSKDLPLDLDGNDRLSDGKPDIGAYEFKPQEEKQDQ